MLSGPARPRPAHVLLPSRVALGVVLLEALLDLALGLLTRPAVALLKRAGELVHGAVDPVQIVVAESTPPLLDLTAHQLPLARQDVLIHLEHGACLRTLLARLGKDNHERS